MSINNQLNSSRGHYQQQGWGLNLSFFLLNYKNFFLISTTNLNKYKIQKQINQSINQSIELCVCLLFFSNKKKETENKKLTNPKWIQLKLLQRDNSVNEE